MEEKSNINQIDFDRLHEVRRELDTKIENKIANIETKIANLDGKIDKKVSWGYLSLIITLVVIGIGGVGTAGGIFIEHFFNQIDELNNKVDSLNKNVAVIGIEDSENDHSRK